MRAVRVGAILALLLALMWSPLSHADVDWKDSCKVATAANITLSGEQTIQGVPLRAGDRVLVKEQTDASENGIFEVAVGAWARARDANSVAELNPGMAVGVELGTETGVWILNGLPGGISLGSTRLSFSPVGGSGSVSASSGPTSIWIDANTDVAPAARNGTFSAPYISFAEAAAAGYWGRDNGGRPTPTSAAEEAAGIVIHVQTGTYEEDAVLPGVGTVTMVVEGLVAIGTMAAPKDVVWDNDADDQVSVANVPTLAIRGPGLLLVWDDVLITTGGPDAVDTARFTMESAIILDAFDASGWAGTGAALQLTLAHTTINGDLTAINADLNEAFDVGVSGNVTVDVYNQLLDCAFGGNFTTTNAPSASRVGFVGTKFEGAFTGPADSFITDGYTHTTWLLAGGTLGGSATVDLRNGSVWGSIDAGDTLVGSTIGATTPTAFAKTHTIANALLPIGTIVRWSADLYVGNDNAADTWTVTVDWDGFTLLTVPAWDAVATESLRLEGEVRVWDADTSRSFARYYNETGPASGFGWTLSDTYTGEVTFSIIGESSSAHANQQLKLRTFDYELLLPDLRTTD